MHRSLRAIFLLLFFAFATHLPLFSQLKKVNFTFNYFGNIDYSLQPGKKTSSFFSLGEQDFFITADINSRWTLLSENVIRYDPKTSTNFSASIERLQLQYKYYKNNSVMIGKIHTPVNYWNDVYHHGRIFFPTINRPVAFQNFVPLHTLGVRLMGQNLGNLNWGYDFVVGNGISATDIGKGNPLKSVTASVHMKPIDGMRIQMSYYFDRITDNKAGSHSGHQTNVSTSGYTGDVDFQLISFSLAYFGNKFELLNEFGQNSSRTDTLGYSHNFTNYLYVGYKIKGKFVPYTFVDLIYITDHDLHLKPAHTIQNGIGFRYEFRPLLNIKAEATYDYHFIKNNSHSHQDLPFPFAARIQLSFGF